MCVCVCVGGGNPIPCVYNAVVFELAVTEHQHSKIRAVFQLSLFTVGWVYVTFLWIMCLAHA